jgi:hypothetical protein
MNLFKHDAEGTYTATTLDIKDLRCNVKIERKGSGKKVSVKILQGTRAEKATLRASQQRNRLTLTAGSPNTLQRIVHMASGDTRVQTKQVIRNTTISGGLVIGNAGNIDFNDQSGDARVGSARGVSFGSGLTVSLVVGAAVKIVE